MFPLVSPFSPKFYWHDQSGNLPQFASTISGNETITNFGPTFAVHMQLRQEKGKFWSSVLHGQSEATTGARGQAEFNWTTLSRVPALTTLLNTKASVLSLSGSGLQMTSLFLGMTQFLAKWMKWLPRRETDLPIVEWFSKRYFIH